ncbi:hypothetical protein, partial [Embleya sp. NPDC005575]|uniref:hypothetical protein n=1 Tax=Embleya sp. NPDC005575 TaxID=3156892 RepID=UPI0033B88245
WAERAWGGTRGDGYHRPFADPLPTRKGSAKLTEQVPTGKERLRVGGDDTPREITRLSFTQIAERVVALGLAEHMTRQRVAQLTDHPDWPVPRAEWTSVGNAVQIPWDERLLAFFRTRDTRDGPKGWNRRGSGRS